MIRRTDTPPRRSVAPERGTRAGSAVPRARGAILVSVLATCAVAAGCISPDPSHPADKYSISVVTRGQVLTSGGNNSPYYALNYRTERAQVPGVLAANPGLAEALQRNGVRYSQIAGILVMPTNVVLVFTD